MRSSFRLTAKILAQKKFFHSSSRMLMPMRDTNGTRWWNDEEIQGRYRQGREEERLQWEGTGKDPNAAGKYTEEEMKAAFEKAEELAKQCVGAAITGVWEKAHSVGESSGIEKEHLRSEQIHEEERKQHEFQLSMRAAGARSEGYAEGLRANPDFKLAKQEGLAEGEKRGSEQARVKAQEELASVLKEVKKKEEQAEEKISNILKEVAKKEIIEKERIIRDYQHSIKLSTRLEKQAAIFVQWKNAVIDKWTPVKTESANGESQKIKPLILFSKNVINNSRKKIGEIPLGFKTHAIHRPWKHRKPTLETIGWNNQDRRFDENTRMLYHDSDKDQVRIYDLLYGSTILHHDRADLGGGVKFRLLCVASSVGLVVMLIMAESDRRAHGETIEQRTSRKKLIKDCTKLEKITPESFDTIAFTQEENKNITECKLGCEEAKELFEAMQREMKARRLSGHGDPRIFGSRTLPDVFADTSDKAVTPLLDKIKSTLYGISERVAKETTKEREEKKKKMYEDLIAEGDKHNGPRR